MPKLIQIRKQVSTCRECELVEHSGEVEFYGSNIVASGPGIYTSEGEDARSVTYAAFFDKGKLLRFEERENTTKPAAKSKYLSWTRHETAALPLTDELMHKDTLIGVRLAIKYGGSTAQPYTAIVVAESGEQYAIKRETAGDFARAGDLEIIKQFQFGSTVFANAEEAEEYSRVRAANWQKEKDEYEAEIAAKVRAGA